jgi:hypothetical protein
MCEVEGGFNGLGEGGPGGRGEEPGWKALGGARVGGGEEEERMHLVQDAEDLEVCVCGRFEGREALGEVVEVLEELGQICRVDTGEMVQGTPVEILDVVFVAEPEDREDVR